MGLIKQGILGGFRKKTGTVVGAYWRRLDVIRALPRNSGKAPTQLQVNQQIKFGLVTSFLSNFSALIDGGFKTANSLSTPMNLAVSYHLREAIIGIEPNFELDLTKLTFSRGKLEMPLEVNATLVVGATIDLSWPHTEENEKFIDATDIIQVLVYNPSKSKFVKVLSGATRADITYSLQLPANFVGDEVHIYVAFSSTKKKMLNSNCTYLGTLTVI
ncbi:MAG: hypothetical protein EOO42_14485 [Flavobacteriales bacterium]|nr:MAG: hypothetical protein EOO42_14485 [Flavobacteriales bacterium]